MFDILTRLSDNEIHGPLPVPVEVWMDEFYAGARPANTDVELGVVRSRNISMIIMLQSISQLQTLYKENKWETMMDNLATVVYLGSGPAAKSTHEWISNLLSTSTVDSRSDNVHLGANGNSGLDFHRAEIKLMTPEQVKRMPPTECIVFIESRPPVYDRKATPFDKPDYGFVATDFLKKRYSEALGLGEYEHPVHTVYDPIHFRYITVEQEKRLQVVTKQEDIESFQEAAKNDPRILTCNIDETELLYLNWNRRKCKRLGLCQKSLFVVPNHLTEQWASDFLRLYPGANILAATKKDFEPANRKKFCSRIATGDYDAVIIGHTQFEKIPLSIERQTAIIEKQIDEIKLAIEQTKAENGERYTIKQMEKTRKSLQVRLDKLNDQSRKDNVVTFEQLGVDRLFVDESHNYKNLFLYTKMRNVAGIAQTEAQKSSDMFAKCQYLDEITGGKGVTFATGTPISNSMTELYTNMRYLQYNTLQKLGLGHFDAWAASFGETQTAIELAPEGTGYRAKTRFAKFFNLPELISLFKESADIQTPDMLNLPVPEAEYENVVLKPSDFQKDMVAALAERAEAVRDKRVESNVDNMLKITNDGRKLALDQRLINDMLPDNDNSKAAACVERAYKIWKDTMEQRSTQLIFCDLSTPKGDGTFNVYEDVKEKLMDKGVPGNEMAFIHDANTELRKAELFAKVRSGQVRFLLGSTAKMGAGTNVQDRLIALHHLDVPWRPSDIEQQEGRILRQGNQNAKVKIFRYVTEGTFDSYSWQLIENKQKFIGQIMTSKSPVRSCEDVDEAALSYAEVKALATGNPYIKEKMDLDIQVARLKLMKANHTSQKYRLEDNITQHYPQQIAHLKESIEGFSKDIQRYKRNKPLEKEDFSITVCGKEYSDKKEAGIALIAICKESKDIDTSVDVGEYLGFSLKVKFDAFYRKFVLNVKGDMSHPIEIGVDPFGNLTRINNALEAMPAELEEAQTKLSNVEHQLETAKIEVNKPFLQEAELSEKLERLVELDALLNMGEKEDSIIENTTEDIIEPVITPTNKFTKRVKPRGPKL